jgi:regulator of RNase E activity RraB
MAIKYPNDEDGQALQQLADDGHDMSQPMLIEFHIAAEDEQTAQRVAAEAARLGYETEVFNDEEEQDLEDDLPAWTCECSRLMKPEYQAIMNAQAELDAIARPLGAYADGWGTFGNAED